MKKVINNLLYNTDTAKRIGHWHNGLAESDFNYCEETLYRKKTGEYFVYGEGQANSPYGKWKGNTGGWGWDIRPYTPAEAREWAEEKLTAEEYAAEFGEPEESASKVALNTLISANARHKLELMREDTGKSISQIVDELITGA